MRKFVMTHRKSNTRLYILTRHGERNAMNQAWINLFGNYNMTPQAFRLHFKMVEL